MIKTICKTLGFMKQSPEDDDKHVEEQSTQVDSDEEVNSNVEVRGLFPPGIENRLNKNYEIYLYGKLLTKFNLQIQDAYQTHVLDEPYNLQCGPECMLPTIHVYDDGDVEFTLMNRGVRTIINFNDSSFYEVFEMFLEEKKQLPDKDIYLFDAVSLDSLYRKLNKQCNMLFSINTVQLKKVSKLYRETPKRVINNF